VFHPKHSVAYVINEMGNSITVFDWESKTGALKQIQEISTLPTGYTNDSSCAEIAVHPNGHFVYGSNRGHDSIAIFKVDAKTGQLTVAGHQPTGGKAPRHFAFDPSGEWIIAQNQSSDNILVFRVNSKTGALQQVGEPTSLGAPVCAVFVPAR
jgi:6-phosphogluconolactonase